jgi:hypothetical protein
VLLPAEERSQARTRLAQEAVRDATYTEHWGDKQLRDLHADLPEVLDHLIEERGMEAMVDPARTSVRFNIFVAPTQCEVGLLVRYHVPVAQGSTRSITFCADVKAMDVDAQTVTLVSDKYDGWGRIWVEEHEDVPVSCLSAMGIWRNEVVLTAAGACVCKNNVCHSPLTYVTYPSFSTGESSTPGLKAHQDNHNGEMPVLCVPHY